MPYITSMTYGRSQTIERMGIAEGLEQGLERQRSMLLRQLTRKIGLIPEGTIDQFTQLSTDDLDGLAEALLDFTCLDDLRDWLGGDR
jgi:Domain of unknown function (DUF4351)